VRTAASEPAVEARGARLVMLPPHSTDLTPVEEYGSKAKAIVRGMTYTVIPITWRNRRSGVAKLKLREMGSRYFFIVAYVWLEKYFSRGDYRRTAVGSGAATRDVRVEDQMSVAPTLRRVMDEQR